MDGMQALKAHWGDLLRARRLALGWSLERAARRADIATPYLFALERGQHSPGDEVRMRLAAAFGVTVEELFPYPAPTADLVAS